MQYSQDQIDAINGITQWLETPEDLSPRVLTGFAGSGKSTLIAEVCRLASAYRCNYHLSAMTHKACDIVTAATNEKCMTVHKLCGLAPGMNKNGQESLVDKNRVHILPDSLIILDEASMVGTRLLKILAKKVKKYRSKLLFVGDPYQLPPINENCPIFDGTIPTYELTTVHRQKGDNPILDIATEFRKFIAGERSDMPVIKTKLNSDGNGVHVITAKEFTEQYIGKYINHQPEDKVNVPMCAYTNKQVDKYNQMIRNSIHFLDGEIKPFYEGEKLISNKVVIDHPNNIILGNNVPVTVKSYSDWVKPYTSIAGVDIEVPVYRVDVIYKRHDPRSNQQVQSSIMLLVPKSKQQYQQVLQAIAKEAKLAKDKPTRNKIWKLLYALKNGIADLRPPYASTTHKAQGSTHEGVFIDLKDIMSCKQLYTRARLIYVALTRATTNVYIREDK